MHAPLLRIQEPEVINVMAKNRDPDQEALEAGLLLSKQEAMFGKKQSICKMSQPTAGRYRYKILCYLITMSHYHIQFPLYSTY